MTALLHSAVRGACPGVPEMIASINRREINVTSEDRLWEFRTCKSETYNLTSRLEAVESHSLTWKRGVCR